MSRQQILLGFFTVFIVLFAVFLRLDSIKKNSFTVHAYTPITLSGELQIIHTDNFTEKKSSIVYYLKTGDQAIALQFTDKPPELLSGTQVEVTGTLTNNTLLIDVTNKNNFKIFKQKTLDVNPSTQKTLAVVLVNFQDNPTYEPFTIDEVRDKTFTGQQSTATYYKEISFNKLTIKGILRDDGDIFGWYTLPYDHLSCNLGGWTTAAVNIAQSHGIDLDTYSNVEFVFSESDCPWWGAATVGGRYSWINGVFPYSSSLVAHELGHDFGAPHAATYNCFDELGHRVPISNNCTTDEYGDPFDVMANSYRHMSSIYKERLGFYNPTNVLNIFQGGQYNLSPIETATVGVQSIRIPIGFDTNGNPIYYFLEFRRPFGFDNFDESDPVVNGVSIRIGKLIERENPTLLIDTTADTPSFVDAPLTVGRTFNDSQRNITIQTVSTFQTDAVIQVNMPIITPTFTPTPTPPLFNVSGHVLKIVAVNQVPKSICPSTGYPGISFATVRAIKGDITAAETQSGINGFFSINIPKGEYKICPMAPYPQGLQLYCTTQNMSQYNPFKEPCTHVVVNDQSLSNIGLVLRQ